MAEPDAPGAIVGDAADANVNGASTLIGNGEIVMAGDTVNVMFWLAPIAAAVEAVTVKVAETVEPAAVTEPEVGEKVIPARAGVMV